MRHAPQCAAEQAQRRGRRVGDRAQVDDDAAVAGRARVVDPPLEPHDRAGVELAGRRDPLDVVAVQEPVGRRRDGFDQGRVGQGGRLIDEPQPAIDPGESENAVDRCGPADDGEPTPAGPGAVVGREQDERSADIRELQRAQVDDDERGVSLGVGQRVVEPGRTPS